jgi:hypothetical protein
MRMKRNFPLFLYILLAILIACALMAFLSGALDTAGIYTDTGRLWERIVWPLMRLTVFISIGLFVGQFIEGMGWTDRLSVMARPFMRWGHLSHQMPYYMGIFSPRMGIRLMLASQGFRIGSLITAGFIYVLGMNIIV